MSGRKRRYGKHRRYGRNKAGAAKLFAIVAIIVIARLAAVFSPEDQKPQQESAPAVSAEGVAGAQIEDVPVVSVEDVPEYSGEPYIIINNNEASFDERYMTEDSFEKYSDLDPLGRCGEAIANVSRDTMPTEKREDIRDVHPSGWENRAYDFIEDGGHVYNRCHLIAFQLAGENANEKNLITGTRYMNVEGMQSFETEIADYIHRTGNHVLYCVTPIYDGDDLVASGVQMQAESVEDDGAGVEFNVYCYNVQPGVYINYSTGKNHAEQ